MNNSMHFFKKSLVLCVVGILSLVTNTAYSAQLEETIVTAQKRSEKLSDVAISAEVFDAQYLQQHSIDNLETLSASVASVFVAKNANASKLFIRGIGSQGNAGMDQSVSVYVDDVYHGRSRSIKAEFLDVAGVEILKGPQSTYLGMNSSAGALSIRTNPAELDIRDGYLQAEIGSDSERRLALVYNAGVTSNLVVRVAASAAESDGYWNMVDPGTGQRVADGGGYESTVLRLSSLWQATDDLQLDIKVEHQSIDRDNPFAWQPSGCDDLYTLGLSDQNGLDAFWQSTGSRRANPLSVPSTCRAGFVDNQLDRNSPASPFNQSQYEADEFRLKLSWDLGFADLVATTGGFDAEYSFAGNDLSHGTAAQRVLWLQDGNSQISQEVRLVSNNSGAMRWMIGGYLHDGEVEFQSGDANGFRVDNPQYQYTLAEQDERVSSLFSSVDWKLSDKFSLGLGLRWTRTEKDFNGFSTTIDNRSLSRNQRQSFGNQILQDTNGEPALYAGFNSRLVNRFNDERESDNETLPTASLRYRVNDESMIYYKWSEGAKAGGFNFRLANLNSEDLRFDNEEVTAHELGIKSKLSESLVIHIAVFDSDYKDLQQNSSRDGDGNISSALIRNAARASSRGLEFDARWQASEQLAFSMAGTFLDAKFDDYRGADCTRLQSAVRNTDVAADFGAIVSAPANAGGPGMGGRGNGAGNNTANRLCAQNLSGARLSFAPDFAARVGLAYRANLSDHLRFDGQFEYFYSDQFFTSPHADELRSQSSYGKWNARLAIADANERWELAVVGRNLNNELTTRQLGQDGDAAASALLDPPRQVLLQFQYNIN